MTKFKKSLKIGLYVLIILPVLVFLGFAGAVSFIDFNRYKPQIEAQVKSLTQRDFNIEGEVDVSVIPFAIHIGKATLSNSPNFADSPPQLRFKELRAELSLSELFLHKRLDVKSVQWIEPQLILSSNQQGQNNWQDLPGIESVLDGLFHQPSGDKPAQTSAESVAETWALSSLVIQDGQVVWQSDAGKDWQLDQLSIVANQLQMNVAFPLHLSADWRQPEAQRAIDLRMNAKLRLPAGWQSIDVIEWQGVMNSKILGQAEFPVVNFTQSGKALRYQWQTSQISLGRWELQALNGTMQLSANGSLDEQLKGQATTSGVAFKKWSEQLNLPLPESLEPYSLGDENTLIDWSYQQGSWEVDQVIRQGGPAVAK